MESEVFFTSTGCCCWWWEEKFPKSLTPSSPWEDGRLNIHWRKRRMSIVCHNIIQVPIYNAELNPPLPTMCGCFGNFFCSEHARLRVRTDQNGNVCFLGRFRKVLSGSALRAYSLTRIDIFSRMKIPRFQTGSDTRRDNWNYD